MAAAASNASLIVAASMAAVEALKDQAGLCRWNYALRSLHQRAKRSIAPLFEVAPKRMMLSPPCMEKWRRGGDGAAERARLTEESMSKVVFWDCWAPK